MLRELIDQARKEIPVVKAEVVRQRVKKTRPELNLPMQLERRVLLKMLGTMLQRTSQKQKVFFLLPKKQYSDNVPDLETEITLFNDIIDRLNKLSVTDKEVNVAGEGFVEDKEVNVTAFISLADQADHDKVRKVVGLLQNLIDAAKTEIGALKKQRDDAQVLFDNAEAASTEADGVWSAANALTKRKQTASKEADEAFNVAKNNAIQRIKALSEEIESLEKAILLIKDLEE